MHDKGWRPRSPSPSRSPQGDIRRPMNSPQCPPTTWYHPPGRSHSGETASHFVLFKNTDMKNRTQSCFDKLCNFSTKIRTWKPLEGLHESMGQGWQDTVSHLNFLLITGTLQKLSVSQILLEGAGGSACFLFNSASDVYGLPLPSSYFSLCITFVLNICWSINNVTVLCWTLGF